MIHEHRKSCEHVTMKHKLWNQVSDQVDDQVRNQVCNQVWGQVLEDYRET